MLKRANERYERQLAGTNETRRKSSNVALEEKSLRLTRSKASPFTSKMYSFVMESPFYVSSPSVAQSLRAAIEKSGNDKLLVILDTSLDISDEQAPGIRYHK